MGLIFEPLGKYIHEVDVRNTDLSITKLMGVNLSKQMMPSVANIVGTDLSNYKVVNKRQFACKLMSVGRDACLPISLKMDDEPVIISSAYYSFEVNDENELMPEYLMMCFLRPDFDRELWFKTGGDVRGGVTWEEFCAIKIPYGRIEDQRRIVNNYGTVQNRADLLRRINQTLFSVLNELYKKMIDESEDLEEKVLDDLCYFQEGYVNPIQTNPDYFDGDVNWIRAGDVLESYIIDTERKLTQAGYDSAGKSAKMFKPGTIMITKSGSYIGRLGILDTFACGNRAVINIEPKKNDNFSLIYLFLKHNQEKISQMATGSVQLNLYVPILQKIAIQVPGKKTIEKFNSVTAPLFREIRNNCREILLLERVKTGYINSFVGKE